MHFKLFSLLGSLTFMMWQIVMPALFIVRYKKLFLFVEAFKNMRKFKYQSKGSTYISHLLAFVEIRLSNVFFWEEKRDSGERWKTCGMQDSHEKGAGMQDQEPPSRPWGYKISTYTLLTLLIDITYTNYTYHIYILYIKSII